MGAMTNRRCEATPRSAQLTRATASVRSAALSGSIPQSPLKKNDAVRGAARVSSVECSATIATGDDDARAASLAGLCSPGIATTHSLRPFAMAHSSVPPRLPGFATQQLGHPAARPETREAQVRSGSLTRQANLPARPGVDVCHLAV
ncbi:hypothetical protein HPB52_023523 [Rhipicephalus sanguineus]|uniref:Uncharacterized protein n=1 Tax=Rhipicephalus sanguineus TaxID=34632 RepID=A0A9D4TC60_RHISA|nr:hypothetical protein HPB52_023523 [Rhipicephalus sanguineus]